MFIIKVCDSVVDNFPLKQRFPKFKYNSLIATPYPGTLLLIDLKLSTRCHLVSCAIFNILVATPRSYTGKILDVIVILLNHTVIGN